MENQNKTLYGLQTVVDFGKHRGKRIYEVIQCDPTYIYWMHHKQFQLTNEVRQASNKRTQERRREAGLSSTPAPKQTSLGYREEAMLNDLVSHLNNKHFDHAFDEENIGL